MNDSERDAFARQKFANIDTGSKTDRFGRPLAPPPPPDNGTTTKEKEVRPKVTGVETVGTTRWLRLETVTYAAPPSFTPRKWDRAVRTTKTSESTADAVAIFVTLRNPEKRGEDKVVLVRQVRNGNGGEGRGRGRKEGGARGGRNFCEAEEEKGGERRRRPGCGPYSTRRGRRSWTAGYGVLPDPPLF